MQCTCYRTVSVIGIQYNVSNVSIIYLSMYFILLQSFFPHWLIQILFYRKWHQSCWVIRIYIFFTPPSIYFQFSGHGSTLKTVLKDTITFIIHINVSTIDEGDKNSIQKFLHITVILWKVTELLIRRQKIKMDHHVFISFFLYFL